MHPSLQKQRGCDTLCCRKNDHLICQILLNWSLVTIWRKVRGALGGAGVLGLWKTTCMKPYNLISVATCYPVVYGAAQEGNEFTKKQRGSNSTDAKWVTCKVESRTTVKRYWHLHWLGRCIPVSSRVYLIKIIIARTAIEPTKKKQNASIYINLLCRICSNM